MNRYIKLLGSGIAMLVASWGLAYFWRIQGSWWFAHRPDWILNVIYTTARPILSTEVWEA